MAQQYNEYCMYWDFYWLFIGHLLLYILGALPSLGMTLETMNKQMPALLDFTFKESRQTYKQINTKY